MSSDGKILAFSSVDVKRKEQHIYTIPVDGGKPKRLVDMQAREPTFSPDGSMIAFVEDGDRIASGTEVVLGFSVCFVVFHFQPRHKRIPLGGPGQPEEKTAQKKPQGPVDRFEPHAELRHPEPFSLLTVVSIIRTCLRWVPNNEANGFLLSPSVRGYSRRSRHRRGRREGFSSPLAGED